MEEQLSNSIEKNCDVPQLIDRDISLPHNGMEGDGDVNTRARESNNACTGNISDESLPIECTKSNCNLLAVNNTCEKVRG
mmetsp:Transcript_21026/g.25775  ORF Transcript_21026/g.25775 Transcript_21026/m.25775 type:complete len:80 (+) Transcript_21026:1275-1514(+)